MSCHLPLETSIFFFFVQWLMGQTVNYLLTEDIYILPHSG